MSDQIITDPAQVREGDVVTLKRGLWSVTGLTYAPCVSNTHVRYLGETGDTLIDACTDDGWRFVSATRPAPVWAPGTVGTATVWGVPGVRVMRADGTGGADVFWLTPCLIQGTRDHGQDNVADFVPDATVTLPTAQQLATVIHRATCYTEMYGAPDGHPHPEDYDAAEAVLALLTGGAR